MAIDAGTIISSLELDTGSFTSSMDEAIGQLGGMEKSGSSLNGVFQKVGRTLGGLAIGQKLLETGQAVVQLGMDFDSSMSNVYGLMSSLNLSQEQMDALRDTAREMGATTKFSASEAADAMGYMALAGWNDQQVIDGLPGVLNLAAAANMDLARASDIVTDTMTPFGMAAEEAGRAANVFAYAQANSNTTVEGLGEAMKYIAPSADAFGMTLEDTAGALGVLANAGIKGSQAGTTLNAMLRDMKKNAEDGAIAIGSTQVALTNADGSYRSYGDIIRDIDKATQGMSESQRDAALSAIFGDESLKGVLATLKQGPDALDQMTAGLYGCEGAAESMAATMGDNLSGDLATLKSGLQETGLALYDFVEPMLRGGVQMMTEGVSALNGALKEIAEGEWGKVGEAILSGISSVIDAAGSWLANLFGFGKQAAEDLPWKETGEAIQTGVGAVLDSAGKWLSSGFEAAKTAIGEIDWKDVGSTISSGISGAIDGLAKLGGSIWDTITGWFGGDEEQDARGNAQSSGRSLTDGMETGIAEGSAAVTAAANTAAAAALGAAAGTLSGDSGTEVTSAWMGGLSSGITGAQETLESDAQAAAEGAQAAAADCLTVEIGRTDGTAYMAGISSGFNGARGALTADAKTVAGEAASAAQRELSYDVGQGIGYNMAAGMAAGVRSGASALYSAISSVASAAVSRAKSALRIASPSGVFADEVGAWIPGGIGVGVTQNMDDALGPLEEVRRSMVGLFDGAFSGVALGRTQAPWSPQCSGSGPTSVTINITGDWTVRSDEDRDAIINELYERISDETRRR